MRSTNQRRTRIVALFIPTAGAVATMTVVFGLILGGGLVAACARQAEVAARGAEVMPFDLDQTVHHFQKLDDGARQTVTVKDPSNQKQIALIQNHLRREAEKFSRGDISDPERIHGVEMPGLARLKSGFGLVDVQYKALPTRGEIRYTTADPSLVTALHEWFTAQVSDHGKHAMDH